MPWMSWPPSPDRLECCAVVALLAETRLLKESYVASSSFAADLCSPVGTAATEVWLTECLEESHAIIRELAENEEHRRGQSILVGSINLVQVVESRKMDKIVLIIFAVIMFILLYCFACAFSTAGQLPGADPMAYIQAEVLKCGLAAASWAILCQSCRDGFCLLKLACLMCSTMCNCFILIQLD